MIDEAPLFQPDDLSAARPPLTEPGPDAHAAAMHVLRRQFAVAGDIRLLEFPGSGAVNENFLVDAGGRRLVLKRRHPPKSNRLEFELRIAELAHRRGVPVAPVVETASGDLVARSPDARAWALFEFVEGGHFQGGPAETEDAASVFARLVIDSTDAPAQHDERWDPLDVGSLRSLLDQASARGDALGDTCSEHGSVVANALDAVEADRESLERELAYIHTDYHPLNLLLRDGQVVCVLDFEDVKEYPVVAALGFGAYKLLRAAIASGRLDDSNRAGAIQSWLDRWHERSVGPEVSGADLGRGARYRVLDLIALILRSCLLEDDHRFAYDLPKQLRSLREIDVLFEDRRLLIA